MNQELQNLFTKIKDEMSLDTCFKNLNLIQSNSNISFKVTPKFYKTERFHIIYYNIEYEKDKDSLSKFYVGGEFSFRKPKLQNTSNFSNYTKVQLKSYNSNFKNICYKCNEILEDCLKGNVEDKSKLTFENSLEILQDDETIIKNPFLEKHPYNQIRLDRKSLKIRILIKNNGFGYLCEINISEIESKIDALKDVSI